MAKEIIIDITWLRPLKLIGILNLLCGLICFLISILLKDWVISDEKENSQFYMGLWQQCMKQSDVTIPGEATTTPPGDEEGWECMPSAAYAGLFIKKYRVVVYIYSKIKKIYLLSANFILLYYKTLANVVCLIIASLYTLTVEAFKLV